MLADRRITDTAQAADPVAALRQRAEDYAPGDTDLAWTRTTPWRADAGRRVRHRAVAPVTAATVTGRAGDPAALLLAGWLRPGSAASTSSRPAAGRPASAGSA